MQRDTHEDQNYWGKEVHFLIKALAEFQQDLDKSEIDNHDVYRLKYAMYLYSLWLLIAMYSRGDPIPELKRQMKQVVTRINDVARQFAPPLNFEVIDDYVHALWLVSFCILLEIETQYVEMLVESIRNDNKDMLYELLVSSMIPGRSRPAKLIHIKQYRKLEHIDKKTSSERRAAINQFLKGYYKSMKNTYWYERHTRSDSNFFGYWSFEAAALAKIYQINENAFDSYIHFPKGF